MPVRSQVRAKGIRVVGRLLRVNQVAGVEVVTREGTASAQLGLAEFCRTEHPKLVGLLSYYCGDRDLAQELAQETLIRVVQHWKKVSVMPSPRAWAHRVGMNLANSWLRRTAAKRRAVQRLSSQTEEVHRDPDAGTAVAVRKAVASLPDRQKTAIILRYYADLPVEEVAEAMRCEKGTVWALTHQAIAALKRAGLNVSEATDE